MDEKALSTIITTIVPIVTGVILAFVGSFLIPLVMKKREKAEQKRSIYEKYAQPLAADAVNLIWRLDEILFEQRGQYLLDQAPPTPFNEYKRISTCYRIAAIIGWIRAIKLEQSYLFYGDQPAVDALRRAVVDFESALADSPRVEVGVVRNLAQLWSIDLPAQADTLRRVAAQVAADMQHFLSKHELKRYHELAGLQGERGMEVVRQVAASMARMLDTQPVSERVLADTCPAALKAIAVRQAWIYRDWQQAIGDTMIKEISGAVRRFDVISYGAFETLLHGAGNPWMERLRDLIIGIDVSRSDPSDLRLQQIGQMARALASLVCSIETLDLERRILDPQACALARKFLAELPPSPAAACAPDAPGLPQATVIDQARGSGEPRSLVGAKT